MTLGRQCAQALERGRLFSAERDARRRMAFLAMASARLAASLDYHQTLDAVAALAVPATGDWCSVHLLDDAGAPQLVTVHHRDPALQELLVELFERYPPDPERGAGIGQAVGERRTVHHSAFPEAVVEAIARDPWHLDALHTPRPRQRAGRAAAGRRARDRRPDRHQRAAGRATPTADVQLVEDLGRADGDGRRQRGALPPGARDRPDAAAVAAAAAGCPRCRGCASRTATCPARRAPRSAATGTTSSR